ncbi:SDR family NAD(P)-dependent oxidoreductase [Leptolyngbya ohadii]|uniref:SDR family NAD(P)-dependent oxidoreductase n=1 Tax=Leptolyngbya ohadii TaxID=1962290 RepID=UPI000B5A0F53|nr:SDR family NAD(P)-dependent oxidoreductase [Leptolyngbya ohadii]
MLIKFKSQADNLCTAALLPHFLSRENGTIVNVFSIGGLDPIFYQVPYTTSKQALAVQKNSPRMGG